MESSTTIGISIPKGLLAKIDSKRGDIPRSKFVQRLVERACAIDDGQEKGGSDLG
jgi:metal-responsive CopG/Arc/MetJ family transcriptional regulator